MKAYSDDKSQTDGEVVLALSPAEALVLYDWLHRFNNGTSDQERLSGENRVLWDMECLLEKALAVPFRADYASEVSKARSIVGE